jgi:hypothetical protein
MAEEVWEVDMKTEHRDIFFVALLTILGLAVRISAPLSASFPLNDGGLFYQMVLDLQQNHFTLPTFTTYNHANIPFAYPPLAFYVYGFLNQISTISLLTLMRFLPAIISTFTIPAFYFLAKDLLNHKDQALFATLAFAVVPRAFAWLIMGGGMTRSLGFLLAILALHQAYLLFSSYSKQRLILTAIFSGLVVLTHPEATVHTFIGATFFYLWKNRTIQGAIYAVIVGISTLAISTLWWVTILIRHGASSFQAAMSASSENSIDSILRFIALFKFEFTDEPFMQLIAVFGLIGFFILIAQRKFGLPIWFVIINLLEPRGGGLYMMLPLSMAVGVTLNQAILPVINSDIRKLRSWTHNAFIGFFVLYGLINALVTASNINQQLTLTKTDIQAFEWVQANTLPESKFMLITQGLPLNDSTSEWFPVFAKRESIATLFGYEWVHDNNFAVRAFSYEALQKCAVQGKSCLDEWLSTKEFSYIYIRNRNNAPLLLIEQMKLSQEYQIVYEYAEIIIFIKAP